MDPVRELPYWPAAVALLIEAGQMTASDYVPTHPDLLLASNGASTEVILVQYMNSSYPMYEPFVLAEAKIRRQKRPQW
jgi:hypothetical protein